MPHWITIATDSELTENDRKAILVQNTPILLIKSNGTYYAMHNVCTHENLPLTEGIVENDMLICPFHGASFCIKNGTVKSAPAFVDLKTYPVRMMEDQIQVQI